MERKVFKHKQLHANLKIKKRINRGTKIMESKIQPNCYKTGNLNGKTEYKNNTKFRGRDIVRPSAQFYRIIQIRIQFYTQNEQYKVKDRIQ